MVDVPSSLLRFFRQEEHARQFMAGEVRFGLLDHYRTIEGPRRDEKEGRVSFYWNSEAPRFTIDKSTGQIVGQADSDQNIHYGGSSLNRYYILSTSHADANVEALAVDFGSFMVRINDPLTLLERIKMVWPNHEWALSDTAYIAAVVYNKDGLVEPDPYLIARFHYSYSQKSSLFEEEREFRYVLTCSVDSKRTLKDFLTINVGDCSDICTLA